MGSINAVPNYLKYYNLPENGASSTGIIFAIFQVGQMTGCAFIWLADWKGRRIPIFCGCFGVLIGTIVTATAKNIPTFIGGRFLLSFFATWASTSAPMYMVELAPPMYRGTVSGLYNTLYYCGSLIATFGTLVESDCWVHMLMEPRQLCMAPTSISVAQIWTGDYRYGCKCCALALCA